MRIDLQASELIRKKAWSSMPTRRSPRKENPGTYFVKERKNEKELTRLTIQDRMITAGMGGVLPEQADSTVFRRMLDVGCGTGNWLLEVAQTYPEVSLVGIDIGQRMVRCARSQAKVHQIHDRVEFHVMDVLGPLGFPAASFDLVNLRFGLSFVRTWEWPKMLNELLRVTRPGGVVRLTDTEVILQSNSPALMQLLGMALCALFRAGHLFTQESTGLTGHLAGLLDQCGCEQVQTKAHAMKFRAGTPEGEAYYQDMMFMAQTLRPFIQKCGCGDPDYMTIYQQALKEMRHPDFCVTWNILTVWGSKPELD